MQILPNVSLLLWWEWEESLCLSLRVGNSYFLSILHLDTMHSPSFFAHRCLTAPHPNNCLTLVHSPKEHTLALRTQQHSTLISTQARLCTPPCNTRTGYKILQVADTFTYIFTNLEPCSLHSTTHHYITAWTKLSNHTTLLLPTIKLTDSP